MSWYEDQLKRKKWKDLSYEVKERDGFSCVLCGSEENLQVHHTYYDGAPWSVRTDSLLTLCDKCHEDVTIFQKHDGSTGAIQILRYMLATESKNTPEICDIASLTCDNPTKKYIHRLEVILNQRPGKLMT